MVKNIINSKAVIIVLIILFITSQYACGTFHNLGDTSKPPSHRDQNLYDEGGGPFGAVSPPVSEGDKLIYGGVYNDLRVFTESPILWIYVIADLPLSIAADTIFLPFTIYWTLTEVDSEIVHAVRDGNKKKVKELIEQGVDVNQKSIEDRSLMEIAIEKINRFGNWDVHYKDIVNILLKNGVDFPEKTLWWASKKGFHKTVKLLIERGADVNERYNGTSPLIAALKRDNEKVVKTLLNNGAQVKPTGNGETALMIAIDYHASEEIAKTIIRKGADVNASNQKGITALMKAANKGKTEMVKLLLQNGAEINETTERGKTALMMASSSSNRGTYETVRTLIKNGADASLETDKGKTALEFAKENGQKKVVQLLQKHMSNE